MPAEDSWRKMAYNDHYEMERASTERDCEISEDDETAHSAPQIQKNSFKGEKYKSLCENIWDFKDDREVRTIVILMLSFLSLCIN